MQKEFIVGTRCFYKWTNMIFGIALDNIVHHDREP